ncbi:MAG: SDR family oxidoreductase [Pseudomonadota bacterium]
MSNIEGKVVAITGASSGIGEATARHLAKKGAHVVLGARRTDNLEKILADIQAEGGTGAFQALDVTDRHNVEAFMQFAEKTFGKLDVVINNAGVMPLSPLAALKVDEWDRMIDVNIKGVLYGIAGALPIMQRQSFGHIINVSSIAGHIVIPTGAVYCATKFAVHALSEGFRQEHNNLRLTIISPGATQSELAGTITHDETAKMVDGLVAMAIPSDAIAAAAAYAISQPGDVDVNEIIVRPTAQPL